MNSDNFLNGIRLSSRQGNVQGISLHLSRILNKAKDAACPARLRVEIYLEAVKAFRSLGRTAEAVKLCDMNIANIPADCFDLLSALKRVRSLLYLDAGDFASARSLIDDTDGLELVLQGNQSVIQRADTDVTVETWLISTEIALAQKDISAAQNYFEKAIVRLASEESELRRKRVNFLHRRKLEQYYHDLSQILKLYGLTLGLITGDGEARNEIFELYETVAQENDIALEKKKLPNVPLLSKLKCLLGIWDNKSEPPIGISFAEAERWSYFGNPDQFNISLENLPATEALAEVSTANHSAIVSAPVGDFGQIVETSENATLLNITMMLIEKMTKSMNGIERVLPDVTSYLRGESVTDYTERHFGGHLLDADLFSLIHNVDKLRITGFIKFSWDRELYKTAVIKGLLPEVVLCGEAVLYAADGVIIDAVFKGQNSTNDVKAAQDNFLLLVRMCFSVQTDEIQPDIHAKTHREPSVSERKRLIKVREIDLAFIMSDLDEQMAGIVKEEGETSFFDAQTDDFDQNESESMISDFEQKKMPPEKAALQDDENLLDL